MDGTLIIMIVVVVLALIAGYFGGRLTTTGALENVAGWGIVFLFGHGDGRVAKVFPDPIRAKRGKQILWFVADFTPHAAPKALTFDWVPHPDHEGRSPAEDNPLEKVTDDLTGKHRKKKGRVRSNVRKGDRFRYNVLEGGTVLADPDVEIMH
jgi:hypothetical protein